MCLYMLVQVPKEDIEGVPSLGAGVTGSWNPPNLGAGNGSS